MDNVFLRRPAFLVPFQVRMVMLYWRFKEIHSIISDLFGPSPHTSCAKVALWGKEYQSGVSEQTCNRLQAQIVKKDKLDLHRSSTSRPKKRLNLICSCTNAVVKGSWAWVWCDPTSVYKLFLLSVLCKESSSASLQLYCSVERSCCLLKKTHVQVCRLRLELVMPGTPPGA